MPCDTQLRSGETIQIRAEGVRRATTRISELLASGRVKAVVGPQGAIAFQGLSDEDRDRITDACIYRRIMAAGTLGAKLAIQKAEMLAGRQVSKSVVGHGTHSHDGGRTWHDHKG